MSDEVRTAVKTYMPRWQKERWAAEADEMDMSQSEYVRVMVQAGRRNVSVDAEEPRSRDGDPGGSAPENGLESRVRERLEREGTLDWDALLAAVTDGVEDRLEDAIQTLEDRDEIRYAPRAGGYTLVDE